MAMYWNVARNVAHHINIVKYVLGQIANAVVMSAQKILAS
jgi:hypothetical protein